MLSVDCVIPCYNSAGVIERAVISVLAQTHPIKKIILVDDASVDNTLDILRRLERRYLNVKVISLSKNMGPSYARNIGWSFADADWVAFLDADDAWNMRKTEIQLSVLSFYKNATIIGSFSKVIDEATNVSEMPSYQDLTKEQVVKINPDLVVFSNPWSTPSVMVLNTVKDRFDTSLKRSEDFLLWATILLNGGVGVRVNLPITYLFKPRFGHAGLSADLLKMQLGEAKNFAKLRSLRLISKKLYFFALVFSYVKFLRRLIISK